MHARAAGGERYRSGGLRAHFQRDAVVVEREAVGEVFDGFHIGHIHSYLVALIHFKLRHAEHGRHGRHVNAHFFAVANHIGGALENHAVFFGLIHRSLPHPRVVAVPRLLRMHF